MTARAARWVRSHLFPDLRNGVITVVVAVLAAAALFRTLRFVFVTGRWEIVRSNLSLFLYGRYPREELWRLVVAVTLAALLGGLVAGVIDRRRRMAAEEAGEPLPRTTRLATIQDVAGRLWPLLLLTVVLLTLAETVTPTFVVAGVAVAGFAGRFTGPALPRRLGTVVCLLPVPLTIALLPFLTAPLGWDEWGGIMLTLLIATVSLIACFPLGLALALGRRSTLPAIRAVCVGFIEFFRGVPLIVLVLMSDTALGFFFPQSLLPGRIVRVMTVFTIFTAAYVAEIVRGGLQSVPRGQTEAAQALGLSPIRTMGLIVLPQALRNVIPALVGQFISMFKDTTLVFAIGLIEPLTVADLVTKQREFDLSNFTESALFAALLFWVGSYTMSRESQRLEKKLGVGTR